jgi:hypothetical protein
MAGNFIPLTMRVRNARDPAQQRQHFDAAAQDDLLAPFGDHRDIARELDCIAITLVADHQNAPGREVHAIPGRGRDLGQLPAASLGQVRHSYSIQPGAISPCANRFCAMAR